MVNAGRCFVQTVGVLVVFTIARAFGLLGPPEVSISILIAALVLIVAAVIPVTNGFLHDSRAQIGGGRLLYELGASIVLLTAIPEEFAFRGVLLGSALRLWGPWRASLITSALFGLWHIAPTLHTMSDNRALGGASATAGGHRLAGREVAGFAGAAAYRLRLFSGQELRPPRPTA